MHVREAVKPAHEDDTSSRTAIEARMQDWAARLRAAIGPEIGVECLRLAVVLGSARPGTTAVEVSLPAGLLPRPETELARAEALRTGRVALAGAVPGTEGGGRPSCLVVPLETGAGWIEIEARIPSEDRVAVIIERVGLAAGWALFLGVQAQAAAQRQSEATAVSALNSIVSLAGAQGFSEAARALVTDLCARFGCDRVSLGLARRRLVRVVAISNTGRFSRSMLLVRLLRAAMEEAVDQEQLLLWPAPPDGADRLTRAQAALAEGDAERSVLTIPLFDGRQQHGALVFERGANRRFDPDEIETLEALAGVLTPLVIEKRENDRWLPARAAVATGRMLAGLLGRRYFALKLAALATMVAAALLVLVERPLTVVADAVVEGAEQRAVTAAFDGFIAAAAVREGDRVMAGDLLFQLDDRDFALERLRLMALRAQAELELDRAISARERAETALVEARLRQIDAELALVGQQIARSSFHAPFDALVLSGDLSRSIGRAVSRGETLMVLSPLREYRVFLSAAEADIARLEPGQDGLLKLAAMPERDFPVELVELVPVARYENGATRFAVEARLLEDQGTLLHGMSGAARIEVAHVPLLELWGKPLWDRARLWLWRNLPL